MADHDDVYISDHKERLLALLLPRFQKPNIQGLVRAVGRGLQDLEDTLYALIVARRRAVAQGGALKQYGIIVGQFHQGESFALHRQLIDARIVTNMRGGQIDALLEVVELIAGPLAGPVRYTPSYPAGYRITVYIAGPLTENRKLQVKNWIINDLTSSGVGVEHITTAPRPAFSFDVTDDDAARAGFDRGRWAVTL